MPVSSNTTSKQPTDQKQGKESAASKTQAACASPPINGGLKPDFIDEDNDMMSPFSTEGLDIRKSLARYKDPRGSCLQ